jgi:hypothetical protein
MKRRSQDGEFHKEQGTGLLRQQDRFPPPSGADMKIKPIFQDTEESGLMTPFILGSDMIPLIRIVRVEMNWDAEPPSCIAKDSRCSAKI